jgi:hypothetical protein
MGEPLVVAAIDMFALLTTRKTAASPETPVASCTVISATNAMLPLANYATGLPSRKRSYG